MSVMMPYFLMEKQLMLYAPNWAIMTTKPTIMCHSMLESNCIFVIIFLLTATMVLLGCMMPIATVHHQRSASLSV